MREIKFRGQNKKTKKFVYGYLHINKDGRTLIKDTDYNVNNGKLNLIPDDVIKETIGQFIGLHDKDGVEIYEGDIIDFWFEEHFNQGNQKGEIVFKEFEGAYYIDCGSVSIAVNSLDIDYSQFEVAGNIYQNPESLEAKSAN